MTDVEILEELKKDLPQISDYITYINCSRKYRKILQGRKPKGDLFTFVIDNWISRQKNQYTFILSTKSLGDMKKHGFTNIALTFLRRGNSLSSYRLVNSNHDEITLEICTSHFINRYNERFLKQPFLSQKQSFVEFYKRNNITTILPMPSEVHNYNHIACYNDGYCFMKMENGVVNIMRTFISKDMLVGSQYDLADITVDSLKNIQSGIVTNLCNAEEELEKACNGEQKIPTIDDYNHVLKLIEQLNEKKARLEKEGKDFDLEYMEMQNNVTILIAGYDWMKAMLKGEDGQLLNHPISMLN